MSTSPDCDTGDWTLFTGQPKHRIDLEAWQSSLGGKRILITGAGGYIGSALAKAIAPLGPAELVLLDVVELGLHLLEHDLPSRQHTDFVVGSVLDTVLLKAIFDRHQPQIVIHAAACKHVPLMEANPFAAASTNVLGTDIIVQMASASYTEQLLLLSTDKAVDPVSIMGATKQIAERIALGSTKSTSTKRKALRLGNVLGSSGSVIPLFLSQIARGGPATVTHPDVTRYLLSIEDAVFHLLSSLSPDTPSGVLIADIGTPHRIQDLAQFLIDRNAPVNHSINIAFTGLRPGDKLEERLFSSQETITPAGVEGLQLVHGPDLPPNTLTASLADIRAAVQTLDLPLLLRSIQAIVPKYRPSPLLSQAALTQEITRA